MVIERAERRGMTRPIDARARSIQVRVTLVDFLAYDHDLRRLSAFELADPGRDQLVQQGVRAQWRAEPELDAGMVPREVVPGRRQVAQQVDAGREEIRDHE